MSEFVYYNDALIRKLEGAFTSSFGVRSIQLTRPPRKDFRDAIRVTLQASEQNQRTILGDGVDPAHCVMEIITKNNTKSGFWFGFSAIFEPTGSKKPSQLHSLEHISVLVFQDILGDLVPCFRAEWMQSAVLDTESKHAQPHWHFTQSPMRIEGIIRAFSTADAGAAREFSPQEEAGIFSGLADFGMFHFAMTPLWEVGGGNASRKRQFDSDQFPEWFKSLTEYIAEQITYLVKHMPTSEVTTTRDFVPHGLAVQS